jgi:hypothetical protein
VSGVTLPFGRTGAALGSMLDLCLGAQEVGSHSWVRRPAVLQMDGPHSFPVFGTC